MCDGGNVPYTSQILAAKHVPNYFGVVVRYDTINHIRRDIAIIARVGKIPRTAMIVAVTDDRMYELYVDVSNFPGRASFAYGVIMGYTAGKRRYRSRY